MRVCVCVCVCVTGEEPQNEACRGAVIISGTPIQVRTQTHTHRHRRTPTRTHLYADGHEVGRCVSGKAVRLMRCLCVCVCACVCVSQNNLGELHALFDLCSAGLLGDRRAFKS